MPNSELISNQVTNWVLTNQNGRATVQIGVAYGTDTEKVRDILLTIAAENDNVAKTNYVPEPKVLFRSFGDSSLNFELFQAAFYGPCLYLALSSFHPAGFARSWKITG